MYKICLCDDDEEFRRSLKRKLYKIGERNHIKMELIEFSSGTGMVFDLDGASEGVDIFFGRRIDAGHYGHRGSAEAKRMGSKGSDCVFLLPAKSMYFRRLM